ncbi:major facilitator superfamily domain-containing protein 6-like [Penaeus japonicus]|uniref:major facilitator superfamily domain-containing protein 6-like n=1 Tax=Penaeus japonicus TaxID=27405 RepID=UPI001C70D362|nr:major facilitator superfamily domain-containing protein 6-like [Penaeus japonicus]XP_042865013.1 major facilitator superfamily domain-containing protein 6-like [Penaeus japonicus]
MMLPPWFVRFRQDLTTKEFVPIKVLFFLIYGASMAMFPFLTLQARSLGITEKELGIVYAFTPVIAIIGPPLTGMIADKIGNFKIFLSLTMAASGGAALVFSAVPAAREHHALPEVLPYSVTCGGSEGPSLTLKEPYQCDFLPDLDTVLFNVTSCEPCRLDGLPDSELHLVTTPCPGGVETGCEISLPPGVSPVLLARLPRKKDAANASFLEPLDWTCPGPADQGIPLDTDTKSAYDIASSTTSNASNDCRLRCAAEVRRRDLCSNEKSTQVFSPMVTFWCYLMVRVLNGLTLATSFTLFDGATMAVLKEHKGDYGLQRLYGNVGAIVVTPLSGVLIDVFSEIFQRQDYRPAFYLYCGFKVIAAVVILFVSLDFRQPSNQVFSDFKTLIRKPEILTFLLVMMISGTCFGLLDTFLFWLLQDLGAKKFLMGITVTVGSIAGVPTLIASGWIMSKLGHANTIILGYAFYVIRMFGYSFIQNPWWCMPFEVLECFTVSLMGAAAVSYASELATPSTLATLQGLYGGIHYGVGRGLGSLLGGFLIGPFGIRNTFRLMGIVCGVTCLSYFIVNRLFFRKLQNQRQEEQKEQKKAEEAEEGNQKEGKIDLKEGKIDLKESKIDLKESKIDLKESKIDPKESQTDLKESKVDPKDAKINPKETKSDPKESLSLEALETVENGVKALPNGKDVKGK